MRQSSNIICVTVAALLGFMPLAQAKNAQTVAHQQTAPQEGRIIHVGVNGMVCDFCAQTLKKTFGKQTSVQNVDISLEDKLVTVHLKPGQDLDDATIKKTITDAGYAVTTIHRM